MKYNIILLFITITKYISLKCKPFKYNTKKVYSIPKIIYKEYLFQKFDGQTDVFVYFDEIHSSN